MISPSERRDLKRYAWLRDNLILRPEYVIDLFANKQIDEIDSIIDDHINRPST